MRINDLQREDFKRVMKEVLLQHEGCGNEITMYQLYHEVTGHPIIPARKVNQTRLLRSIIAELQREGLPIVHTSGIDGGYYLATTQQEIEEEASWHHKRALSSLRREKALLKLSTTDLLKQVEIELEQTEEHQHHE